MSDNNNNKYYYSFDLSRVPSLHNFVNGDEVFDCKCEDRCIKCKPVSVTNVSVTNCKSSNNEKNDSKSLYYLVNYDKKFMQKRVESGIEYDYIQYLRSVVLNENRKVVCFSPPMCEPKHVELDVSSVRFAEEFVEGTMVNLFYNSSNDVQQWEFSTKNMVSPLLGAGGKCFRRMFLEACSASELNFDDLQKKYSYSFVMQHPDNVIVAPVKSAALYIVAIYYADGTTVYEMDRSIVNWGRFSKVRHPARFGMKGEEDFNKIMDVWASSNSLYYYPGVMFRTQGGERFKFRNPNYEYVKNAKGAEDKSRFVYLHLKKLGKLKAHFDRFPEDELKFFRHQTNMYNYTHNLHKNYLDCYVFKKAVLKDYPVEYKQNMFNLHNSYNLFLRPNGKRVNMSYVIEFMNEQSVSSQMFVIKKFEDVVKHHSDKSLTSNSNSNSSNVVKTPEQEKEDVLCPGAP